MSKEFNLFVQGLNEADWQKLDKLAHEKYGTKKNFIIQKIHEEAI
jgi:hypothetical protein